MKLLGATVADGQVSGVCENWVGHGLCPTPRQDPARASLCPPSGPRWFQTGPWCVSLAWSISLVSRVVHSGKAPCSCAMGGDPVPHCRAAQSWAMCSQCWCQTAAGACGPAAFRSAQGSLSVLSRVGLARWTACGLQEARTRHRWASDGSCWCVGFCSAQ